MNQTFFNPAPSSVRCNAAPFIAAICFQAVCTLTQYKMVRINLYYAFNTLALIYHIMAVKCDVLELITI
jgi:hypothetical protein